ncbi:hypothetical protein SLEP1_g27737 [Rubroshorea leprosula]|uniref:Uncharacterized protein n=1 Tax=Rubroshorea leprosula TaxID=152421 RepID=A0AAV5JXE6_9ROSI|nr:hypothetical protein SLEP1_g27737 [Rubroshorea leprosula]
MILGRELLLQNSRRLLPLLGPVCSWKILVLDRSVS